MPSSQNQKPVAGLSKPYMARTPTPGPAPTESVQDMAPDSRQRLVVSNDHPDLANITLVWLIGGSY